MASIMKLTFSGLLLFALTYTLDSKQVCVPLTNPVCANAGYSMTADFPPINGQSYQNAKGSELQTYLALLTSCSPVYSSTILCSLHFPKCDPDMDGPHLPCKSVCNEFVSKCSSLLNIGSTKGILEVLCDLLPEYGDGKNTTCFLPKDFNRTNAAPGARKDKCYSISSANCTADLHYNTTFYDAAAQAKSEGHVLQPIIDAKCSTGTQKYTCFSRFPPCYSDTKDIKVPCQSLCTKVAKECKDVLDANVIPLPDCEVFYPNSSGINGLCSLTKWPAPWTNGSRFVVPTNITPTATPTPTKKRPPITKKPASKKCSPLRMKACAHAGYINTFDYPAVGGKPYQVAKSKHLDFYVPLLQSCSKLASMILCSMYAPKCEDEHYPNPVLPCRRVCYQFVKECHSHLRFAAVRGLFISVCDLLPIQNTKETPCFEPPNFKSDAGGTSKDVCHPIVSKSKCGDDLNYTSSFIDAKEQSASQFHLMTTIINTKCSKDIEKFFCFTRLPPCNGDNDISVQLPCRHLCEKVVRECKHEYDKQGWQAPDCDFLLPNATGVHGLCKISSFPVPLRHIRSEKPTNRPPGPCGEFLLKMARTAHGTILYPRMVYPYHSLVTGIQNLLKRPGFWEKCQEWRNYLVPENVMADIHQGRVWQGLATNGFLSRSNSLGLMLNIDWFRPHKHSPGSIGVVYLVVMDLPRKERYLIENVLIVGILPGPSEPKLTANTFLKPLTEELKQLWNQEHRFSVHGSWVTKKLKIGLLCVSCDIPASRKIGGFMGHMANQGCSRCKKNFYIDGKLDFSGFSRDEWLSRVSDEHKEQAKESLLETTPTRQQAFCSQAGARYSVLHELQYFDCIQYFVIDPMHNLFLGTAKHIMKNIWQSVEKPLLKSEDFEEIQKRVDATIVPQDIGRIPGKIENAFGGFTADQWQSWVLLYSVPSLQGILPKEHLECWTLFVNACKYLGKKVITVEDISIGDDFMMKFLDKFVSLYGADSVTPNMHLHCHLAECLTDYGPFHGFWCFSFERYNGILGAFHTNNRSIEVQLMRKFQNQAKSKVYTSPEMFSDHFEQFFPESQSKGSVKTTMDPVECMFAYRRQRTVDISNLDSSDWSDNTFLECHPPLKDATLDVDDVRYLRKVYSKLLGVESEMLSIPFTISRFASTKIGSVLYGSTLSRTLRNAYVLANWAGHEGRLICNMNSETRVGEVSFFFRHRIKVIYPSSSNYFIFYMARVNWYNKHPAERHYGDLLKICSNDFDVFGPSCFIPQQRIKSRVVVAHGQHERENILMVSTLPGD